MHFLTKYFSFSEGKRNFKNSNYRANSRFRLRDFKNFNRRIGDPCHEIQQEQWAPRQSNRKGFEKVTRKKIERYVYRCVTISISYPIYRLINYN